MIAAPLTELAARADALAAAIGPAASVIDGGSAIGGGSLPDDTLPTRLVRIDPGGTVGGADEIARRLRTGRPAVMARIADDMVVLDPRTVPPAMDADLGRAVREALG